MQSETLHEKVSKTFQEAKIFHRVIDSFGPGFERKWRRVVRQSAVEDVERAFKKVMKEVKEKEAEIKLYPVMYAHTEVWVYAHYVSDHRAYILSATKMKSESAWSVAHKMSTRAVYLPVKVFEELIQELMASILDGKLDENIHLKAEPLIYQTMYEKFPAQLYEPRYKEEDTNSST